MASWFKTGCYSCALAVALGAFGAHGLKSRVDPAMIEIWQTAVQYHFIHAFGMMLNAVAPKVSDNAGVHIAECFIQPIRKKWLGAITPFGGLSFILGWVLLGLRN